MPYIFIITIITCAILMRFYIRLGQGFGCGSDFFYLEASSLFICLARGRRLACALRSRFAARSGALAEASACINIPRNIPIPINASTDKRNHTSVLVQRPHCHRVDEGSRQHPQHCSLFHLSPCPISLSSPPPVLGNLHCT